MSRRKKNKKPKVDIDYDWVDYHESCAINGDMIVREYTFPYYVKQWDPRDC